VDTAFKAAGILEETYNWGFALPEDVLETMSNHHWLGRKTGAGFYIRKGKKHISNPGLNNLSGPDKQKKTEREEDEIRERLLGAMAAEAVRCLEDEVVPSPLHVDMALVLGAGFPTFRGGIFRHVDSLGLARIADRLQEYARRHGPRFAPPALLVRMAENSEKFYP
jgi:3-hydroxyacyl-CoA dehydrogenase/enoyl-CoA hydratase/3-hydroxybutyryl-CoA epimerase